MILGAKPLTAFQAKAINRVSAVTEGEDQIQKQYASGCVWMPQFIKTYEFMECASVSELRKCFCFYRRRVIHFALHEFTNARLGVYRGTGQGAPGAKSPPVRIPHLRWPPRMFSI